MSRLNWIPGWYQPGESLWSVANKLAYVYATGVSDILALLAGVGSRGREGWLFPRREQAPSMLSSLEIQEGPEVRLFAGTAEQVELAERFNWQLAIRYCPQCLEGYVHQLRFQDCRAERCLIHGCELLDRCPHCGGFLDPLCPMAWTCSYCGQPLVQVGPNWLEGFRTKTGGKVSTLSAQLIRHEKPVWGEYVDPQVVAHHTYEAHAALAAHVLGEHSDCVPRELQEASMSTSANVHFECPVASSVVFLAHQLGFDGQCTDGAWIPVKATRTNALTALMADIAAIPSIQHRDVVRATVQRWLVEMLEAMSQAADSGHRSAVWAPGLVREPASQVAVNKQLHSSRLSQAVSRASSFCKASATL